MTGARADEARPYFLWSLADKHTLSLFHLTHTCISTQTQISNFRSQRRNCLFYLYDEEGWIVIAGHLQSWMNESVDEVDGVVFQVKLSDIWQFNRLCWKNVLFDKVSLGFWVMEITSIKAFKDISRTNTCTFLFLQLLTATNKNIFENRFEEDEKKQIPQLSFLKVTHFNLSSLESWRSQMGFSIILIVSCVKLFWSFDASSSLFLASVHEIFKKHLLYSTSIFISFLTHSFKHPWSIQSIINPSRSSVPGCSGSIQQSLR